MPRLSEPYVPGKRDRRYWTDAEVDVVRQHYERLGPGYCLSVLPGRTILGVYQRARMLGLSRKENHAPPRRIGTSFDEAIKRRWPELKGRGAVAALADELGLPRHAVSNRAKRLGLTLPHRKEPPWSQPEEELLRQAPVNDPPAASRFFAAHGFRRSPASIMVHCKRVGLSRRRRDVFSATAAAKLLGIDNKTMTVWCRDGLVKATRRGTSRLPQQGGDVWTILPSDLRAFIIDQLDRLDIRKVDKHAFVALLIGQHDLSASHQVGIA